MNQQIIVKCQLCNKELCGDALINERCGYILEKIPLCEECRIRQDKMASEIMKNLKKK